MKAKIKYSDIRHYKYQTLDDYSHKTAIRPAATIIEPSIRPYLYLGVDGVLTISTGYAWDGPSGPTIDTKNFMRGSLVHDALYQLMRTSRIGMEWRKHADELLVEICKEDGMWAPRRALVYAGVRAFGHGSAKPQPEQRHKVYTAP